ncbi:MAG: homoserine dehydrogenase [Calditrichaceae bacterium]
MSKKKEINFALLGFGKLGTGFFDIWMNKKDKIQEQTGFNLVLKKILIKNKHFKRPVKNLDKNLITTDLDDILNDPDIQIVIDVMGGIEPTFTIIKKIINSKKHVISANRALLASKMHELAELGNINKTYIFPEPSLGGGIPIISALQRDLIANRITSVTGILSGTSNFILSEMTEKQISLKEALQSQEIIKIGESLSIIDYDGSDAAQKVAILAAASFGVEVNFLSIFAEGISDITEFDIRCAEDFGYRFKLLAILRDHPDSFEIRVHPTLVPRDHPLNSVKGRYNAYYIMTDLLGDYMIYGKGVGIESTSSLLLRDIVEIGTRLYHRPTKVNYQLSWNNKPVLPIKEIQTSYYLRFPCVDKPGVIGQIANILGQYSINIGSAHAEVDKKANNDSFGFVHIFVDNSKEKDIHEALDKIRELDIIKDRIKLFRILD